MSGFSVGVDAPDGVSTFLDELRWISLGRDCILRKLLHLLRFKPGSIIVVGCLAAQANGREFQAVVSASCLVLSTGHGVVLRQKPQSAGPCKTPSRNCKCRRGFRLQRSVRTSESRSP